jgi:hypothetical protein
MKQDLSNQDKPSKRTKRTNMNQKIKMLLMSTTVTGLWLALPGILQAQLEKVTITATIYEQGAQSDNGHTTTISPPTKHPVTTVNFLEQLAKDEAAEGRWGGGHFPAGAQLVYNGSGFEIAQGTNELVDVSDILTVAFNGQNDVTNGSYLDAKGSGTAPFTSSNYKLVTLAYDDSSSTGELTFSVTGLGILTATATTPNARTGSFKQSETFSLQDGTGEGTLTGTPFVVTGFTLTASGSANESQ